MSLPDNNNNEPRKGPMSVIDRGVATARTASDVLRTAATATVAPSEGEAVPVIHTETLRNVRLNAALLHENRIISDAQASPAGPAYKVLRTRLLQSMRANRWSTLGITSTAPSEGK